MSHFINCALTRASFAFLLFEQKQEGKYNNSKQQGWKKWQIEKKSFGAPLINAPGCLPGNSLGYNWAKQSGKWENCARKSCFASIILTAPSQFWERHQICPGWLVEDFWRNITEQDQDRWSKWENKGGEVVIMPQRLAHKQKHALPLDLLVLSAHDLKTLRFT